MNTVPNDQANFDVPGVEFYDAASNRQMKYVYPSADHWTAGWILYKNPGNGQWVTLRKASDADIKAIDQARAKTSDKQEGK